MSNPDALSLTLPKSGSGTRVRRKRIKPPGPWFWLWLWQVCVIVLAIVLTIIGGGYAALPAQGLILVSSWKCMIAAYEDKPIPYIWPMVCLPVAILYGFGLVIVEFVTV